MAPSAEAELEWIEGHGAVAVGIIRAFHHPCDSKDANKCLSRYLSKLGGPNYLLRVHLERSNGWQHMPIVQTRAQFDALFSCCREGKEGFKCV